MSNSGTLAVKFREHLEAQGLSKNEQANKIAETIANIKGNVQKAEAADLDKTAPLNYTWRAKSKAALRLYGIEHQKLLWEISCERTRKEKAEQNTLERHFIDLVKAKFDAVVLSELWAEARRRVA